MFIATKFKLNKHQNSNQVKLKITVIELLKNNEN
jgi:hypothetical protein